ncbi:unnamed protein product [Plutella xylostella]|uniref:(diamondback moth) hypothetical protein n=1 Tax=Plutella xylostella TaxID=51655 RepID=A0A8S4D4Y7_PLUXY|nr:unnamed protein product [Plutella xylostella]
MLDRFNCSPRRLASRALPKLPILRWARGYSAAAAAGDLVAGATVAMTLIPQSIAYASLAGLEPQYGLYASLVGGFVYAYLGTCPQINIGPSALISLLTFTYTNGTNADYAVLLCFVAGIAEVVAGIAQLGFLVQLVSLPVVSGFTSAAALTIASSQVKGLLGLSFKSESFIDTWRGVVTHIKEVRLADTGLSLLCCLVLFGMKSLKDQRSPKSLKKVLWFSSVARNAVVVILAATLAYFLHEDTTHPLILTGEITSGLPSPRLPFLSSGNGTATAPVSAMLRHLGSGLLVVPLVSIISNVAIAKAFSNGKTLDATQEIIALGVCNVVGSFFSSFPINGSFTRSALSDASGVRTPAAGFYTGLLVLLTLLFLTPLFYYIPRAAFASVITCAVLHMVDVDIVRKLWSANKVDVIPLAATFSLCLSLGVEVGLLCGVAVDALLLLLYHTAPPLQLQFVHVKVDVIPLAATFCLCLSLGVELGLLCGVAVDALLLLLYHTAPPLQLQFVHVKVDVIPLAATFCLCLSLGVELGLLCGVAVDALLLLLLYHIAPPLQLQFVHDGVLPPHHAIYPVGGLHYAGAEKIRSKLMKLQDSKAEFNQSKSEKSSKNVVKSNDTESSVVTVKVPEINNILVVYCSRLYRVDYTVLQSLKMIVQEWRGTIVWYCASAALRHQLDCSMEGLRYCDSHEELQRTLGEMMLLTQYALSLCGMIFLQKSDKHQLWKPLREW